MTKKPVAAVAPSETIIVGIEPEAGDVAAIVRAVLASPALIDALAERLSAKLGAAPRPVAPAGGGEAASDEDLDGRYGDPEVRFDPKQWTKKGGDSQKMKHFSQCPAEFLDMLAETYDYFAGQEDGRGDKDSKGRPKSYWTRKDAARARGWAVRVRERGEAEAPDGKDWLSPLACSAHRPAPERVSGLGPL